MNKFKNILAAIIISPAALVVVLGAIAFSPFYAMFWAGDRLSSELDKYNYRKRQEKK